MTTGTDSIGQTPSSLECYVVSIKFIELKCLFNQWLYSRKFLLHSFKCAAFIWLQYSL